MDTFNDFLVSAFVTPSLTKYLLLHKLRADDPVREFFQEFHALWLRHVLMNPLYEPFEQLAGPMKASFDAHVQGLGKRLLKGLQGQANVGASTAYY